MSNSELGALDHGSILGLKDVSIPGDLRAHPLIVSKFFYALPQRLLQSVEKELRVHPHFKSPQWALEVRLSKVVQGCPESVGFHDARHLTFTYLHPRQFNEGFRQKVIEDFGIEAAKSIFGAGAEELDKLHANYRAFLGWLLTNAEFVEEHRIAWERWGELFCQYGIPILQPEGGRDREGSLTLPVHERKFLESADQAFEELCQRWRLQGFAGPFLPVPIALQTPMIDTPLAQYSASQAGVKTIALPDFLAVDRGRLQDLIENSTVKSDDHLSDWLGIVDPHTPNKSAMGRYERKFELQHYYRVLARRHSELLNRNKVKLQVAFATYFNICEDSIEQDFKQIEKQLGRNWTEIGPEM